MPRGDGTGPFGLGPLTGRGFGPCGYEMRRGYGRGYGRRLGLRNAPITLTKEEQRQILEAELKELEVKKQEIEARLKELE